MCYLKKMKILEMLSHPKHLPDAWGITGRGQDSSKTHVIWLELQPLFPLLLRRPLLHPSPASIKVPALVKAGGVICVRRLSLVRKGLSQAAPVVVSLAIATALMHLLVCEF